MNQSDGSKADLKLPVVTLEQAKEQSASNTQRVCLIGCDALSWDVMEPLLKKGELPNFQALINTGSKGVLRSFTQDIYSPRIWTTVATGFMPEKHGISFFLISPSNNLDDSETAGSDNRKCLAIWNILSYFKKRVMAIGWMVSWPAEVIKGDMITDFMEYDYGSYPAQLKEKYMGRFRSRKAIFQQGKDLFYHLDSNGQTKNKTDRYTKMYARKMSNFLGTFKRDETNLEIAEDLLSQKDYALSMIYLRGVDIASHYYWRYSQLADNDPRLKGMEHLKAKYKDTIASYYKWVDEAIGRIVKKLPADTSVIVCSDHGFETNIYEMKLYNTGPLLTILGYRSVQLPGVTSTINLVQDLSDPIDACRRFVLAENGLKAAGKTGEPDRISILESLKQDLLKVVDQDGNPVFEIPDETACKMIEIPDKRVLYLRVKSTLDYNNKLFWNDQSIDIGKLLRFQEMSGNHKREGVIITAGGVFRHGLKIKNADVQDITPTILPILGLPVGQDMDGETLINLYKKDFLEQNPLTAIDTYENKIQRKRMTDKPETRPQIKEQLKVIGYIN